jgi:peptidoglycan/LPS O-acetylase OafA/YrhL
MAKMTYPIYLLHECFGIGLVVILKDLGLNYSSGRILSIIITIIISTIIVQIYEPIAKVKLRKLFMWK